MNIIRALIVNDDEMVKKLKFTNTKKASNSEVFFLNMLTRLNEKYNATTGKDFPFVVAQMRNKF